MKTLPKVAAFLRKYWYILVGAVLVSILLLRRGLVLRTLQNLRRKLDTSRAQLEEIQAKQKLDQGLAEIAELNVQAAATREEIQATTNAISDLNEEYSQVTGRINTARDWKALEALREAGNKR